MANVLLHKGAAHAASKQTTSLVPVGLSYT